MPSREIHNTFNSLFFGFTGNDIHQFMDRAAKKLRSKHRKVGHGLVTLGMMMSSKKFRRKYTAKQIFKTWQFHKILDGIFSGLKDYAKQKNPKYGKKPSVLESIKRLKKEIFRL